MTKLICHVKDEQRYMIWHLQHYNGKVNGFLLISFWILLILQRNYILPNVDFSSVPLTSLQALLMAVTLLIELGYKFLKGKWRLRFQGLFHLGCHLFLWVWFLFLFFFLKILFKLSVTTNILTSIVIDLLLIFLFVHFRHTPLAHSSEAW